MGLMIDDRRLMIVKIAPEGARIDFTHFGRSSHRVSSGVPRYGFA